jgi:hypothetical protein
LVVLIVEASIASLKVTDITLLRETLLAFAAGLLAVIEGVVGAVDGPFDSSFLHAAVNNTAAVANTEISFLYFIIFLLLLIPATGGQM